MIADKAEAARALEEIDATRAKSAAFHRYRSAAPHFIMWGFVWLIGNGTTQFAPPMVINYTWLGLIVCAIIGASVLTRRQAARLGDDAQSRAKWKRIDQRIGASIGLIWMFIFAVAFLLGPPTYKEMNALISISAGFAYMAFGIWVGGRITIVGAATAALTLVGFYLVKDYYFLWMALVGGGALFAGGLWLKRA